MDKLQSEGTKMEDTVIQARREREKQGPCEVEISFGGESDLHRHLDSCDKNPGHHGFVPIDQFSVEHLPSGCRDKGLVMDLVRAVSGLTGRVSVNYVSERRPEDVKGVLFPRYEKSGRGMMRVGTGFVRKVENNTENSKTCQCKECLNSPTPKTEFAYIHIVTAAHVVYDDLEAAHTTCCLFFDKGGTPENCSGVVTLTGMTITKTHAKFDVCEMKHATHDMTLANKMADMVKLWCDLTGTLYDRYRLSKPEKQESLLPTEEPSCVSDPLNIIVSHPHGCSKMVSIGRYFEMDEIGKNSIPFTYTTATCPGSSGSYVIMLDEARYPNWGNLLVHCGNCENNRNLNYSSLYLLNFFDIPVLSWSNESST